MRPSPVLLQLGFGHGRAFLQAWQAWRAWGGEDARAPRLDFIAVMPALPPAAALLEAHHGTALQPLAEALVAQWPPPTRNLHRLGFEQGRVHLLLAPGEALERLPQLRAQVERFLIDELPAGDLQRLAKGLAKGLARLAAPQACLRGPSGLQTALQSAGFETVSDGTLLQAVYRPRFQLRRRGAAPPSGERHALIVGAGLAGCATAAALAEQGWRSTLLDACAAPAEQASGNPAGLFHGIVNLQDGVHARFNRAAALQAQRSVQLAIDRGLARGSTRGLLRLETAKTAARMQAELQALQLPPDYVQALDAAQASERCGLPLQHPAWFYPGGGWVQPAALAQAFLHRAGAAAQFRGGVSVHSLRRAALGWQALDAAGAVVAEAATVVLANAADAMRLAPGMAWPLRAVRGQISLCKAQQLALPRLPLAGSGYLLPEVDGLALFGASAQPDDDDPAVRAADHLFNLQRLARLLAQPLPSLQDLHGRVGWRCVAADRLPLVGAVPEAAGALERRQGRLEDLPRQPGLFVFAALGSRGIAWSELGAQVLAAHISGAPMPLEARLVQALDPGRFLLREARSRPSAS